MADIRPFTALRFATDVVGDVADVVMPPEAVISTSAQELLRARSPWNLAHVDVTRGHRRGAEAQSFHADAGARLHSWFRSGALRFDDEPSFYAYQQTFSVRGRSIVRSGFLGLLRLPEKGSDTVLPHERTLDGPIDDRLQLLRECGVQLSPLLLLHRDPERRIGALLDRVLDDKCDVELRTDDDVEHRLQKITDTATISELVRLIEPHQVLIADGHHRYGTAIRYRDEERARGAKPDAPSEFALAFFAGADDPGIEVWPTHRLMRNLPDFDRERWLKALEDTFTAEELDPNESGPAIEERVAEAGRTTPSLALLFPATMTLERRIVLLRLRDTSAKALESAGIHPVAARLSASLLHEFILEQVGGVTRRDQATPRHLRFERDVERLLESLEIGDIDVAAVLPPASIHDIIALSNEGLFMPQKSTFFYPKVLSGLVLHAIDFPKS